MFEILAAATETVIQTPTTLQTYGPVGALLLTLGGWKGIAQGILWLQSRNGNGNPRRMIDERACDHRHEAEERARLTEMGSLVKSMDKLESAITRLHERFDEIVKGK